MSKEYGSHVVRTIWQMSREQQLVGLTRGVIHIMEESFFFLSIEAIYLKAP
jgi:hypothetical protein